MSTLPEYIYRVATNPSSPSHFQATTLAQPFTLEEQEALSALYHLLTLPVDKLLITLPDPSELDGWFWP